MLTLFADNLLPVLLAAGAGYVMVWRLGLDPRPVSQLAFFVFAPCLVFQIIVDSRLEPKALARMAAFTVVSLLGLAALAAAAARALGAERSVVAAVALVVLLPNAGNFGLSVNLFAFGEAGLAHASVFFIVSAVLTFTVGVFVASLGRSGLKETLRGLLRVPAIGAVLLAFALVATDRHLPQPMGKAVKLLSQASIPIFLVILGMQLRGRGIAGPWRPVGLAVGLRLIGGIATGIVLARWFGIEGTAFQAAVLQSGMPSAVISIVVAAEYGCQPRFVTTVVVITTLLSPVTLTLLLSFLGA